MNATPLRVGSAPPWSASLEVSVCLQGEGCSVAGERESLFFSVITSTTNKEIPSRDVATNCSLCDHSLFRDGGGCSGQGVLEPCKRSARPWHAFCSLSRLQPEKGNLSRMCISFLSLPSRLSSTHPPCPRLSQNVCCPRHSLPGLGPLPLLAPPLFPFRCL